MRIWCDLPPANSIASVSVRAVDLQAENDSNRLSRKQSDSTGIKQVAEYLQKEDRLQWFIKKVMPHNEVQLVANLRLKSSDRTEELKQQVGPIYVNFEIPMHNISYLKVKYLKINGPSKDNAHRWVRYMTTSQSYTLRVD